MTIDIYSVSLKDRLKLWCDAEKLGESQERSDQMNMTIDIYSFIKRLSKAMM